MAKIQNFFKIPKRHKKKLALLTFNSYLCTAMKHLFLIFLTCCSLTLFLSMTRIEDKKPVMTTAEALFQGDRNYGFGNYETALKYYDLARDIDKTNIRALTRLGMMYKSGLGTHRDYKKAREYYEDAAALNDGGAAFNVALFYLTGQGVSKDYDKGMSWLQKASDLGCADAQYQIGCLYYNGQGVEQSYDLAMEWFKKASEKRYLSAMVNIGFMCAKGLGCKADPAVAVLWYKAAAEYGSAEAMRNLGGCYSFGDGVEKDEDEGLKWYKKAAIAGDKESINYLRSIGQYESPEKQYQEIPLDITMDPEESTTEPKNNQ